MKAADRPPGPGSPVPSSGARFGPYEAERLLGRGGSGTVYLARRIDGAYSQRVAVKVVPLPLERRTARERVERERLILARLTHPHIARLLDAGTTPEGDAYLVMEYVDGHPITEYVREHRLPVAARLALFRDVCAAVEFAHQHLVVHRDLKPSNILVDAAGTAKLLDFGTATILGADDLTVTGMGSMTIAYASPEQLNGTPISTLTDIFSLGALLFEMLTGTRMLDDNLAGRSRGEAHWDRRAVAQELARIVAKATAAEPGERYATAGDLAEDVRRFVHHEPVLAEEQTAGYRAWKFVRRHRAAVAGAAALLAGLSAATIIAVWQARAARAAGAQAASRFQDVRQLTRVLFVDLYDELAKAPGGTQVQDALIQKALAQFDALVRDSNRDPELLAEAGEAYLRMGNLLGNPYNNNKGQEARALATYRQGLDLLGDAEGSAAVDAARGHLHRATGRVLAAQGDSKGALAELRLAVTALEAAARKAPSIDAEADLINARTGIGDILFDSDPKGALAMYDASAVALEAIRKKDPSRDSNGVLDYKRGACEEMLGHLPAAVEHYRRALASNDRLPKESRTRPDNLRARASILSVLGSALVATDRADEGLKALTESAAIARGLVASDPASARPLFSLAANLSNISAAYRYIDRPQALHAALEDEAGVWAELLKRTRLPLYLSGAAANLDSLSQSFAALGDGPRARETMRRALQLFREVIGGKPSPEDRRRYAAALLEGGAPELRDPKAALAQLEQAMRDSGTPSEPLLRARGLALLRTGRRADAATVLQQSLDILSDASKGAAPPRDIAKVQAWLAEARARQD